MTVLRDPEGHGLKRGVWYCANASEGMITSHGAHTLAGVVGCGPEERHLLQQALESNQLLLRQKESAERVGSA